MNLPLWNVWFIGPQEDWHVDQLITVVHQENGNLLGTLIVDRVTSSRLADQSNFDSQFRITATMSDIYRIAQERVISSQLEPEVVVTNVELRLLTGSENSLNEPTQKTISQVNAHRAIKLYTDGGSRGNPGPSASGYVIFDMNDMVVHEGGVYLGVTTNNQAEYQAVRYGLEHASKIGVQEVMVFMDSLLVVNQMKGIYKIKNRDLWPIHDAIKELITRFKSVTFTHVPRELNKKADAVVNQILDQATSGQDVAFTS